MPVSLSVSRSVRRRRIGSAVSVGLVLLAGCASLPDDELLASSAVVATRSRESGAVIEVARFSALRPGDALPAEWQPYVVTPSKRPTAYRLVDSGDGVAVRAHAERSASGLVRVLRADPARHAILEWRWRVPALIPGADPRRAPREDSPVRLIVSFHGDGEKLDFADRAKLRLARAISGQALPYATLMYVWANSLPPETVVRNPHTDRIRMIVVESGAQRLGRWISVRRNLREDYRRAFGEEPWDIVAIALMTDTDNTDSAATGDYGDITLRVAP